MRGERQARNLSSKLATTRGHTERRTYRLLADYWISRRTAARVVIGGTSAVAPLWAGLVALANALNGRATGFLNPLLYAHATALHDITQGNSGAFEAAVGWDACTGLGTPIGQEVAKVMAGQS